MLTRERVIDTAVEVLRSYGLADLSMRRLARELQVQPGALYWHVTSKQELLVEVAGRLLDEVALPAPGGDPALAVRAVATDIRAALLRVPDSADVVALAYAVQPTTLQAVRRLGEALGRLGLRGAAAEHATALVVHHVLGSVVSVQNQRATAAGENMLHAAGGQDACFQAGMGIILAGLSAPL